VHTTITYRRSHEAVIVEQSTHLYVLDASGTLSRLDDDSASLAREVLRIVERPCTREQLLDELALLVGGPVEPVQVVDDLLAFLQEKRAISAIVSSAKRDDPPTGTRPRLRLLLGLTGAVQTMHAPALVSMLQAEGHAVRVVMTEKARKFVRPRALEALTHEPVVDSLWSTDPSAPAPHIALAEWADVMLIAPSSATTVARIAQGLCTDPVSATAIATRAALLVAPSMNEAMYDSPAVQRNLTQLRDDGVHVIHPMTGLEVATNPDHRVSMSGVMVAPHELVRLLRALVASQLRTRHPLAASLDRDMHEWSARYKATAETRPWDADTLDDGALELALKYSAPTDRVLDLGCGSGLWATQLAMHNRRVTAVDAASGAIDSARTRADSARVHWIAANALNTVLAGPFDMVHDRAFLHVLPRYARALYLDRVQRWVRTDGALILTAHCENTSESLGTSRFRTEAITSLFQRWFTLISAHDCTMRAPAGEAIAARRYVLIRNATR
jgi:2-polyprenyl-3-methyl-5-hydroxy-6-metoxy-1,4-benzoquinol methylase/3-polyprenyl-4-hydroxybenzoate decarboxylase